MRVLHAPINIANQMTTLTRGLRACGVDALACEFRPSWTAYPVDLSLRLDEGRTRLHSWLRQLRFFLWAAANFDVFHFHFGKSLLPRNGDLAWLERRGRRVVMHYWGTDVRPGSHGSRAASERRRIGRMRRVTRHVQTALVADDELASFVRPFFAHTVCVRQAIDIEAYQPAPPRSDETVPLVVHAPSRPNIKGTPAVLAAVEQLQSRYHFEFRLVEKVPHREAMEIYQRADVVVDQLLSGTHGLFAVEAMALAKPVVCYINPAWRSGYPGDLPLVSATPETLAEELASLLTDGRRRRALGEAGRAYVERYHDARIVVDGLRRLYEGAGEP